MARFNTHPQPHQLTLICGRLPTRRRTLHHDPLPVPPVPPVPPVLPVPPAVGPVPAAKAVPPPAVPYVPVRTSVPDAPHGATAGSARRSSVLACTAPAFAPCCAALQEGTRRSWKASQVSAASPRQVNRVLTII